MDTLLVEQLADRWRADLEAWAIPNEILRHATTPPWAHPVALFTVEGEVDDSPSHRAARAALPDHGSVLDIGCGGGRASFALADRAAQVVGVDEQQGMLDAFAAGAAERGLAHVEVLGRWPDAEPAAPVCDVVVCHHVAFNVQSIVPFLRALNDRARRRVVIEMPFQHPMSNLNPLWQRFWGLARPTTPTSDDLIAICAAMGLDVQSERWVDERFGARVDIDDHERMVGIARRLCLPDERADEVAAALAELGPMPPRDLVTVWWDVEALPS